MLFILNQVALFIQNLPVYILDGVTLVINEFFVAVALVIGKLFAVLPAMPDAPTLPGGNWANWLNWFIPVAGLLGGFFSLLVMYGTYMLYRYTLSLVRAL